MPNLRKVRAKDSLYYYNFYKYFVLGQKEFHAAINKVGKAIDKVFDNIYQYSFTSKILE